MSSDTEIVVEDPDAPAEESPAVASTRTVECVVYLLLTGLALLLAFDNWRTGMGWEADGPQAGYFPFYLSLILAAASIFGLVSIFLSRMDEGKIFVTRDQLRRVIQVFIPTLLFCLATQWLGLYVASFPADRRLHVEGRTHRTLEIIADRFCVLGDHVCYFRYCVRRHHA